MYTPWSALTDSEKAPYRARAAESKYAARAGDTFLELLGEHYYKEVVDPVFREASEKHQRVQAAAAKAIIPQSRCEPRRVYRVESRNLTLGIFNPTDGGFLGLREKLGSTYVFTEYHFDRGAPFGTARPWMATDLYLPPTTGLTESARGIRAWLEWAEAQYPPEDMYEYFERLDTTRKETT